MVSALWQGRHPYRHFGRSGISRGVKTLSDAQTVKGGRYGPTFHEPGGRGGRTIGTKRTLLVEILGLPVAADACSARPHDVVAARELLRERIDGLPRLRAIVGDRAYTVSPASPRARVSASTSSASRPAARPSSRSDR